MNFVFSLLSIAVWVLILYFIGKWFYKRERELLEIKCRIIGQQIASVIQANLSDSNK